MAECVKSKYRHFMLLLYPDDELCNHKVVIESLHLFNAVWILHNQDLDDNGNLKKEHIHAVLSFVNPRYLSAVSNELGLDERWIEPIRDVRASMAYLLHLNDSTKHTYSIDECHGNVDSLRKTLILRRDICIILYVFFFVKEQYFLYFPAIKISMTNHFLSLLDYLDKFKIYVIIREV